MWEKSYLVRECKNRLRLIISLFRCLFGISPLHFHSNLKKKKKKEVKQMLLLNFKTCADVIRNCYFAFLAIGNTRKIPTCICITFHYTFKHGLACMTSFSYLVSKMSVRTRNLAFFVDVYKKRVG